MLLKYWRMHFQGGLEERLLWHVVLLAQRGLDSCLKILPRKSLNRLVFIFFYNFEDPLFKDLLL